MDPSKRIIVNTATQYLKSLINICLSLYSTRLVLAQLSVKDYGIYSVVAGVVGILGYLVNSLVVTTQRYLSFYQGKGDVEEVRGIFANSLFIHFVLGALFCVVLLALEVPLMDGFLNIPAERLSAAKWVYVTMVFMLFVTIVTSPFKAFLIAQENIVYISVIEILDGFLKLALALSLIVVGFDKLEYYAVGMTAVLLVNLLAFMLYVFFKYKESRFPLKRSIISREKIGNLLGFAGWTTYGMLAGMCQTQGLAVVLNKFFGTVVNAAFGIASQVNGAVRFVSTSILNAMNPQIMKAEGNGDRQKMLALAEKESKFSTALMMIVSIPVMVEMEGILSFWLEEVPPHTATFCRALMLAFLVDQTTLGLHAANQATGRIKVYSIIMFTPKVLIVPIAWIVFKMRLPIAVMMAIYVGIELTVALARIPFLKVTTGLSMGEYLRKVVLPLLPMAVILVACCWLMVSMLTLKYRFLLTAVVAASVGVLALFGMILTKAEKDYLLRLLKIRR